MPQPSRYRIETHPSLAEGWTLERLTPVSHLFGAAGMRIGPDGRIHVAQVSGSQISAIDIATGAVEAISPLGGDIVAPDDLVFDARGNLYATEVMNERVGVRAPDGTTRVLRDDLPMVNGITMHQGRLFVDECRIGGRLMELDLDGGAPRLLLEDIPMPNALEMGPDGKLYFPVMGANEIWRIDPAGGAPEKVAGDLGVPDSVKFDARGFIVSTQVASGQVLRIDPRTGARELLAQLEPGLDNVVFHGERIFVSEFAGRIVELLGDGRTRDLLAGGFNGPFGLTVGNDGEVYIADGPKMQRLLPDGGLHTVGMLFTPGCPGYMRGLATADGNGFIVTTSAGAVALYRPVEQHSDILADGFDQLYGVAIAPGGDVIVAELGAGRVVAIRGGQSEALATGLSQPIDVAVTADGICLIAEASAGRVVKAVRGGTETVVDGLGTPHGIVVLGETLYIADVGLKAVIAVDLATGARRTIAADLAIGPPPGVTPKFLRGFPPLSGPMGPFAGLSAGPDGTLYLSADGEGSIMALRLPNLPA
ncbi:SMP-30/gluconolactonase/LRE family protein [Sphingomonas naphthae]|uniref:SMP-30/gluconolactonase/LRE family protein n=1 Tax=Sphingomonas naphthae TaxID=1813468 RepID=A0ABY7TJX1_9SPHN|nr:SMP-30/gluconolactonase/LRE family protein [Sphingomonas naphthae]WCT73459.1 SMP-30/gluconolactonase/LRE family protein [Sphingomonas naphthae]